MAKRRRAKRTRVAMVGTFDVANFGDLLFPGLAAHELEQRLGDVRIDLFAYHPLSSPPWPHRVRGLGDLPGRIAGYDLLLLGGGHIIRTDKTVAPGYLPTDASVHHPLGMWLVPALLAATSGVPAAYNAVGVSAELADWAHPLVRTALQSAAYVSVRDHASARTLARIAPDLVVHVVPDTAFGLGALALAGKPGRSLNGRVHANGARPAALGDRPYVILQPTGMLAPDREHVIAALDAARASGMAVLELPIGPVLGDTPGMLDLPGETVVPDVAPTPADMVRLIAGAEGVVAQSLHAGVVALTHGVPVLRPRAETGSKYAILDGFDSVHRLGAGDPAEVFGRRDPEPRLAELAARVGAHWDAVAKVGRTGRGAPAPAALRMVAGLPGRFEAFAERSEEHAAALVRAAQYDAVAARADHLSDELRTAQAWRTEVETELARLRERERTLDQIESGGWWAIRERFAPLIPVASRVRGAMLAARRIARRFAS